MRNARLLFSLVMLCATGLSAAIAAEAEVMPLDPIRSEQAGILAGVRAKSGVYANLSPRDRDQMISRQSRMLEMIEGKQTSAELEEAEKMELASTLEWIDDTVQRADDERMVCERVRVIGSNMKERICMTVAQRRQASERAKDAMTRSQRN